ncbi:MAG TPA: PEGA domain-containing protein [Acidobacteriaceae bacterium]|jgi:hypothetical protein|nr:PEGA domain-containing protein [Acidobacteriaceae bacterium]
MKAGVFAAVAVMCMAGLVYAQDKPRVYVTDSNSWTVSSGGGGSVEGFGAAGSGGARPQTAEIIKTFGERCPQVVVNDRVKMSDYVVELDHEGGKGLFRHKDKIAVFVRTSGDSVYSKSTLSVGGAVQGACEAITSHWAAHAKELEAAVDAMPAQPAARTVAIVAQPGASFAISSNPAGADIEVNGNFMGSTPSTIRLKPGDYTVVVSMKGYEPWQRKLHVTAGNVHIDANLEPVPAT